MAAGAILLGLGTALSSQGSALWHFYLSFGLLMGTGLALTGSVPFTRTLSHWFIRKRATALGITFFGTGGPYILYPFIAFLIGSVGWRGTFLVEAALVGVIILPLVSLLIRHRPEEMGLLPDGAAEVVQNEGEQAREIRDKAWAATEWTLLKAMKTYPFWLMCFTAFSMWGVAEHILLAHQVAFAVDVGYSRMYASSVVGVLFGIMVAIGCIVALISDRIGREATYTLATLLGVAGIAVLMLITDTSQPWMLYFYAVFFGLGMGMTIPTIAASATDIFSGKRAGAVIGFIWFGFALGGTLGPWVGGFIFDRMGTYLPAFAVSALMFIASCVSLWIAAPRKVRPVAGRVKRAA